MGNCPTSSSMTNEDDREANCRQGELRIPNHFLPSPLFLLLYLKLSPFAATFNDHVLHWFPSFLPLGYRKGHIHVLRREKNGYLQGIKESVEMEREEEETKRRGRALHFFSLWHWTVQEFSRGAVIHWVARRRQDGSFALISSGTPDQLLAPLHSICPLRAPRPLRGLGLSAEIRFL